MDLMQMGMFQYGLVEQQLQSPRLVFSYNIINEKKYSIETNEILLFHCFSL